MHRSFGFEGTTKSTDWQQIRRGPSLAAVRAHVAKLAGYGPARGR
ncbi:hypothetical protein [Prosthecomicrobium sp. N25]